MQHAALLQHTVGAHGPRSRHAPLAFSQSTNRQDPWGKPLFFRFVRVEPAQL